MAHMNQEKKKVLEPAIKEICKQFGVKGTLRVQNHSRLVLTVRKGAIDFWAADKMKDTEWHLKQYGSIGNRLQYAKHTSKWGYDVQRASSAQNFTGEAGIFLVAAVCLSGTTSVFLVHNHPSGSVTPSPSDDALTDRVYRALKLVGVTLLDHVALQLALL